MRCEQVLQTAQKGGRPKITCDQMATFFYQNTLDNICYALCYGHYAQLGAALKYFKSITMDEYKIWRVINE